MQSRITDRDLALIVNFLYITAKGKRAAGRERHTASER